MLTESPLHAYRMQQLIKERHKDDVVNASQRASIYQTIQRLERDGLIEIEGTDRAENRPERTTYRITDEGRSWVRRWLSAMLAVPAAEYPQFSAALSFLPNIAEIEAVELLRERVIAVASRLAALQAELDAYGGVLPRVFLIETEYTARILQAELDYVRELIAAVSSGEVDWDERGGHTAG